ncbi:MAG: hypothetical protein ACYC35_23905 [Pirellulales bacterium]
MATISGKDGKVTSGASDVADITRWTFTKKSNNPAYASSSTAGFKKRLGGIREGSGSIEGKFQNNAAPALAEGDAVTLKLYLDATHFYTVPAVIDAVSVEVDINAGQIVGWSAEFSTNGAWTEPSY